MRFYKKGQGYKQYNKGYPKHHIGGHWNLFFLVRLYRSEIRMPEEAQL